MGIRDSARPARTGTPGANDNAAGVAALLETARALTATPTLHDVCLGAYANEEPPFYQTPSMGSVVHAKSVARHPGKDKMCIRDRFFMNNAAHLA